MDEFRDNSETPECVDSHVGGSSGACQTLPALTEHNQRRNTNVESRAEDVVIGSVESLSTEMTQHRRVWVPSTPACRFAVTASVCCLCCLPLCRNAQLSTQPELPLHESVLWLVFMNSVCVIFPLQQRSLPLDSRSVCSMFTQFACSVVLIQKMRMLIQSDCCNHITW